MLVNAWRVRRRGLYLTPRKGNRTNMKSRHTRAAACLLAAAGLLCRDATGAEAMESTPAPTVQPAYGAGRWFPASPAALRDTVETFINEATVAVTGRLVAAIAPHAGYQYSGRVAGHTYRAIRDAAQAGNKPDLVVVLGFSHRAGFPGAAILPGDALATPLGAAPLDARAAQELAAAGGPLLRLDARPHAGEHSAENQVPFLQAALPGTPLLIVLTGDHDPATLNALYNALTALGRHRALLVVASTDLLHDPDYETVRRTDAETLALITGLRRDRLAAAWSYGRQVCCGIAPVLTAMHVAEAAGCRTGSLLAYRNSGDDYPESRGEWVVGYGAVVFAAP